MFLFAAKCRDKRWLVFAAVGVWKLALFLFSTQPVPSNDAFFYDGAVVHQLLHGGYFNPSLALALPVSGARVFSAYPPLYQGVLWLWMSVCGTSAVSAMALHLMLFGGYAVVLYLILKRLAPPVWCFHFAGAFLLLITFHDRPDSLAHLFGMLAILSWIGSRRVLSTGELNLPRGGRTGFMALFTVLTLCTSVQIGAVYLFLIWLGSVVTSIAGKEKFPVAAMAATVLIPGALVVLVKFGYPVWWSGFLEHARQTPSWTGLRWPGLDDLLKVARTIPGVCLIFLLLPWAWLKQHNNAEYSAYARHELVLLPTLLTALGVVVASLFVLTANTVAIANYLQPLLVSCHLALCAALFPGQRWLRSQVVCLGLAVTLGSIRAVGMSTWGLACAHDVGYTAAIRQVDGALAKLPPGSKVVVSSAFLYEAARHGDLTPIHSDWTHPAKDGSTDLQALIALKPRELILTQFDYYRRYQAVVEELRQEPLFSQLTVDDWAELRPPDAYPSLQRVVQHISWAPVIVELSWRP